MIFKDSINLIFNFAKMMFTILIIAHWSACIFYNIGKLEQNKGNVSWLMK
jgi:hypothetical protein